VSQEVRLGFDQQVCDRREAGPKTVGHPTRGMPPSGLPAAPRGSGPAFQDASGQTSQPGRQALAKAVQVERHEA
jgi:hypothetical protein